MAKETFYFTHDYNARTDSKIKLLIRDHGMQGYGIYWSIIEDLYNNANALPLDCDSIAFDLRVKSDKVKKVIEGYGLFVIEGGIFGSLSVQKRLEERNEKSKTARTNALKRWEKDATAMPPHSKGNAIKEKKGKEVKEKKEKESIEDRKQKFASTLQPFLEIYGKEMLNAFYKYWTEHGPDDKKFRREKEKSWDIERRLQTWKSNESKFNNNGKSEKRESNTNDLRNLNAGATAILVGGNNSAG